MDKLFISTLAESRRDAMVDLILGRKLWNGDGGLLLKTPDDLYEYQMIDSMVDSQVEASWLSVCVDAVQQHLGSILNGMEPGFEDTVVPPEILDDWNDMQSYPVWAGLERLKNDASNYIVPQLRLRKTTLFKTLENSLGQMRLTDDSVQVAVQEYLLKFQQVCDLTLRSGYVDGSNAQSAAYYFVAQERTPPFGYFWRKAQVELSNQSTMLNPTAWEEWQPIKVLTSGKVLAIRLVRWAGRLSVVWVEWHDQLSDSERMQFRWSLEIKCSYLSFNDRWSPEFSLFQQNYDHDVSGGQFTAVVMAQTDPKNEQLALFYSTRTSLNGQALDSDIEIFQTRDALFRQLKDDETTLRELQLFRFNGDSLQFKIGRNERTASTVMRVENGAGQIPGIYNAYFSLEAISYRTIESGIAWDTWWVRGRSTAKVPLKYALKELSIAWKGSYAGQDVEVQIQNSSEGKIEVVCHLSKEGGIDFSLQLNDGVIATFIKSDFSKNGETESWSALKIYLLSSVQVSRLSTLTASEILDGAGFSAPQLSTRFASQQNIVRNANQYASPEFKITFAARTISDPADWSGPCTMDGDFTTPWVMYRRNRSVPLGMPMPFYFGVETPLDGTTYGRNHFTLTFNTPLKLFTVPSIDKSNAQGAEFLAFNNPVQTLKYVRLNTLFGFALIERASVSTQALLAWDTQHINEPAAPDGSLEKNGPFEAANGKSMWELFFHLPHLIASLLVTEGRYEEVQDWLHYLFNPQAKEITVPSNPHPDDPVVIPAPAYWRCRPLLGDINPAYEAFAPADPDAIGYTAPVHFRKAIFIAYVRNIIERGDWFYRQLTRDSLTQAKLLYVRGLALMGTPPEIKTSHSWVPRTIAELLAEASSQQALKQFESEFNLQVADVPMGTSARTRFGLLGSKVFRPPLDEQVVRVWNDLESRMFNLRHSLTLDGKPVVIPLFSPPIDPMELLIAMGQGANGRPRESGGQLVVVPYRFSYMLDVCKNMVNTLISNGEQVRQYMDLFNRGEQEELQLRHVTQLGSYARAIQEETLANLIGSRKALEQNAALVQQRIDHYAALVKDGVSPAEYDVMQDTELAKHLGLGVESFQTISAGLDVLPNIFGLAGGGYRLAAIPNALGGALNIAASVLMMGAEKNAINEQYRRRDVEWRFALSQAQQEILGVNEQIVAHEYSINAANANLRQTDVANAQALELYEFFKRRSTNGELYSWLLGQLKCMYFQAYDAVVALCLSAENCWKFEMGEYDVRHIRPNVWLDQWHGLSAGESLRHDLLMMEKSHLSRHERRLDLVKTISLRQLLTGPDATEADKKQWKDLIEGNIGELTFNLGQKLFDLDFPGHYRRQVIAVGITLPGMLGAYEDARAILQQTGSHTAIKPTIESVRFLHQLASGGVAPSEVKINVRSSQQIAVSSGLNDNGVVSLEFNNGRYAPFEGTGAVSSWKLKFPRYIDPRQSQFIESLSDIIMHLSYMADDGGTAFAAEVEQELPPQ